MSALQHEGPLTEAAITCVIADDHPLVSELLARYLAENGIIVVAKARDGREAVAEIIERRPSVALVDLRMPHVNGIEVARRLAQQPSSVTPMLLYTAHGDRDQLIHAIDSGVRGFVQKDAPLDEVLRAIRLVAEGGTYIDPVLGSVLASPEAAARLNVLSKREREVLGLLANGMTTDHTARTLFISPETVRVHLRNAMAKLDADTRTHAVAKALRQALIS